jgi:hypothetical protein
MITIGDNSTTTDELNAKIKYKETNINRIIKISDDLFVIEADINDQQRFVGYTLKVDKVLKGASTTMIKIIPAYKFQSNKAIESSIANTNYNMKVGGAYALSLVEFDYEDDYEINSSGTTLEELLSIGHYIPLDTLPITIQIYIKFVGGVAGNIGDITLDIATYM